MTSRKYSFPTVETVRGRKLSCSDRIICSTRVRGEKLCHQEETQFSHCRMSCILSAAMGSPVSPQIRVGGAPLLVNFTMVRSRLREEKVILRRRSPHEGTGRWHHDIIGMTVEGRACTATDAPTIRRSTRHLQTVSPSLPRLKFASRR